MNIKSIKLIVAVLTLLSLPCLSEGTGDHAGDHATDNTSNKYPKMKVSGSIFVDYDKYNEYFTEDALNGDDELELRRARVNVTGDFNKHWSAKLKIDLHDGVSVKDAYIKYDAWDWANVTLGKQKEPFGLERLMSASDLPFIERSMMSSTISLERTYGVNVAGEQSGVNWQLGYFQDDNAQKTNAVTGRLAWGLVGAKNNLAHIGASFSERSLHGEAFRINERLEVHTADSLIEGDRIDANELSQFGAEFAFQYKGLLNMAEWQQSLVTANDGREHSYEGGYYLMSYLLSGKNRKYKNGMLDSVKTKNDWEVSLRYSQLKLIEENSQGRVLSLGVNYIINNDMKLMANYVKSEYDDNGVDFGSGEAVSLRALYRF